MPRSWHRHPVLGSRHLLGIGRCPAAPPAPSKGKIKVLGKKKIDPSPAKDKGDPARCAQGFVWRVARPDDLVCVTPEA